MAVRSARGCFLAAFLGKLATPRLLSHGSEAGGHKGQLPEAPAAADVRAALGQPVTPAPLPCWQAPTARCQCTLLWQLTIWTPDGDLGRPGQRLRGETPPRLPCLLPPCLEFNPSALPMETHLYETLKLPLAWLQHTGSPCKTTTHTQIGPCRG